MCGRKQTGAAGTTRKAGGWCRISERRVLPTIRVCGSAGEPTTWHLNRPSLHCCTCTGVRPLSNIFGLRLSRSVVRKMPSNEDTCMVLRCRDYRSEVHSLQIPPMTLQPSLKKEKGSRRRYNLSLSLSLSVRVAVFFGESFSFQFLFGALTVHYVALISHLALRAATERGSN